MIPGVKSSNDLILGTILDSYHQFHQFPSRALLFSCPKRGQEAPPNISSDL